MPLAFSNTRIPRAPVTDSGAERENGDPDVDPNQWQTIITAIRREESETGAEPAQAITSYRMGLL